MSKIIAGYAWTAPFVSVCVSCIEYKWAFKANLLLMTEENHLHVIDLSLIHCCLHVGNCVLICMFLSYMLGRLLILAPCVFLMCPTCVLCTLWVILCIPGTLIFWVAFVILITKCSLWLTSLCFLDLFLSNRLKTLLRPLFSYLGFLPHLGVGPPKPNRLQTSLSKERDKLCNSIHI